MLRIRRPQPASFSRRPIGALPPPTACDDTVGRIQQALNAGITDGKIPLADESGILGIDVDGRAGVVTQGMLDFALGPSWEMHMAPAILRMVREKYGTGPGPEFSCTKPGLGWKGAAGIAAAGLGAVALYFVARGNQP